VTNVSAAGYLQYNDPGYWVFNQQIQDHVSWFRGRHSLKGGGISADCVYQEPVDAAMPVRVHDVLQSIHGLPLCRFPVRYSEHQPARFSGLEAGQLARHMEFFVTDEFKATPKLTLSWGCATNTIRSGRSGMDCRLSSISARVRSSCQTGP